MINSSPHSFWQIWLLSKPCLQSPGDERGIAFYLFFFSLSVLSTCKSLTTFDASGFSTEGATDLTYFFEHCINLEYVRFRNLDFSSCNKYSYSRFFSGCTKLKRVDFNGVVPMVGVNNYNIFPTKTEQPIEVYVGSEEEKTFVQNYLANGATNVIIYIGDMPF